MKMYRILLMSMLLWSCRPDVAIDEKEVEQVLTSYGVQHLQTTVVIHTQQGDIRLRLYAQTPLHRANFVRLIEKGYYSQGEFYRIVSDFMIQGGQPGAPAQSFTIPAEFRNEFIHKKGALAMARFDENNPRKRSSPTEFFIVRGSRYDAESLQAEARTNGRTYTPEQIETYLKLGGDASLDNKYTVFGEVVSGLDIVEKLADVAVFETDKPLKKIPFQIAIE